MFVVPHPLTLFQGARGDKIQSFLPRPFRERIEVRVKNLMISKNTFFCRSLRLCGYPFPYGHALLPNPCIPQNRLTAQARSEKVDL